MNKLKIDYPCSPTLAFVFIIIFEIMPEKFWI